MTSKILDRDIRKELHEYLKLQNEKSLIIDELFVGYNSRIDVACITDEMIGYEIKSEGDTLNRLPNQAEFYSKVFNKLFIITTEKHLDKIKLIIPKWWGIFLVQKGTSSIMLRKIRESQKKY